jgi:hypothetical protein
MMSNQLRSTDANIYRLAFLVPTLRTTSSAFAIFYFEMWLWLWREYILHCGLWLWLWQQYVVHCGLWLWLCILVLAFSWNSILSSATWSHSTLVKPSAVSLLAPYEYILTKRLAFCSFGSTMLPISDRHGSHLITTSRSKTTNRNRGLRK